MQNLASKFVLALNPILRYSDCQHRCASKSRKGTWNLNKRFICLAAILSFFAFKYTSTVHASTKVETPASVQEEATVSAERRPNVVLIMTDDQGWGDFGFHGNQVIQTPNLDQVAGRSVRFTNFYVSPVCSPTRACLMTGRYNYRTRSVDTYVGRSMMDPDEWTIAEALKAAGYRTGIFGKWHLGDCHPMRPIDQGFDVSVTHLGGGLCQPSDPIENKQRYTNPILFRNGKPFQSKGYCTDVYFENAIEFIRQSNAESKPFFAYIATNAPHGPFHDVPTDLKKQYLEQSEALLELPVVRPRNPVQEADKLASIAAMITNVDQNVGKLLHQLEELSLSENTLVIFLTDNGPNTMRYVGPHRGMKSGVHQGGVRTPLWMYWPAKIGEDREIDLLSAHIDVFPTLLELCGGRVPDDRKIDGRSLWPAVNDDTVQWPERSIVLQTHRGDVPQKFHHFMIRQGDWKLVHPSGFGRQKLPEELKFELYNLREDPGEANNLVEVETESAESLKQLYSDWFDDVSSTRPNNYAPPRIYLGTSHESPTVLNRNEWRAPNWNNNTVGKWMVDVRTAGTYQVRVLFREPMVGATVHLQIGQQTVQLPAKEDTLDTVFQVDVPVGETEITAWREVALTSGKTKRDELKSAKRFGAYHVYCEKLTDD